MEWITCLKEVLQYIEGHLCDEIDIGAMSERVYISPFYLQKGFQILSGYSLGEYIRGRRLYQAALDLSRTEDTVLDIALRYGYETPESFTKAIARFHGATPTQLRGDPSRIRRFLPLHIQIRITGGDKMNYTVGPMEGLSLIGFERVFDMESAYARIPAFWAEIGEKYWEQGNAAVSPDDPRRKAVADCCIGEYGVCIDDLGPGQFRYLIAGRYTGGEVPEGMTLYGAPAGEWVKFRCVGPLPETLQSLNTAVFRDWLPGNPEFEFSGNCSIEWYSSNGKPTDADYESGIWLPVRRK